MRTPKLDRKDIKSKILTKLIQNHMGRHRAIGMGELYREVFGREWNHRINDTRMLRKIINEMRWEGIPILSTSESIRGGYYLRNSDNELNDWLELNIVKPALKKLALGAKIRKQTLAHYIGQMKLDLGPEAEKS